MVAEAQRNVIISLKLAADPKNQATAEQVARQAQSVVAAGNDAYDQLRKLASDSQKQITELQKIQSGLRLDIEKQEQNERISLMEDTLVKLIAIEERQNHLLEKSAEDRQRKQEAKQEKQREATNKKRIKEAQELTKKIQEAERTRVESTQKANESAVAALQGMASMVEGAAKLGLVSEENFQKFSKHYEVVQSGIQVFKGATEMYSKTRKALIALSTATKAQTLANKLMSTSNLRVATTNALASASGSVGAKGVGRAAKSVAGIATGVAVENAASGGTVLGGAKVLGGLALGVAKIGGVALAATEGIQILRRSLGDTSDSAESVTGALWGWWEASEQAAESTKNLTKAEKRTQQIREARKRFEGQEITRSGLQKDLRNASNRISEARASVAGESSYQTADRQRLNALNEVRAAEAAIAEDRRVQDERVAAGHFRSQENELRLLRQSESAHNSLLDAELNRLSVIRDQNKATIEQLRAEREKLVTLQEAKRVETQSLNPKLGKLSLGLQKRAIKNAEKLDAGGQLDRRDVSILQEARVGQKQINDFYAKKGKSVAGSETFTKIFGSRQLGQNLLETKESAESLRVKSSELSNKDQEAVRQVDSAALLFKQFNEDRVKQEADLKGVLVETIRGLSQNNVVQQIQQASADAADAINQQGMATVDSIKTMQAAMLKGHEDMQNQLVKFQLNQNWNNQP